MNTIKVAITRDWAYASPKKKEIEGDYHTYRKNRTCEILKNKKGGDRILSVYWFAILFIVAGGVFAMVYLFYSSPYDVRDLEGDILGNVLADCIVNGGVFNSSIFNEENIVEKCHLNFKGNEEEYYFEVKFYEFNSFSLDENKKILSEPLVSISGGFVNLLSDCKIQENQEYGRISKCVEKRFYSLDEAGKQYIINILSIVRKTQQNAP